MKKEVLPANKKRFMALLTNSRDSCLAALRKNNGKQNSPILELSEEKLTKNIQHGLLMLPRKTLRYRERWGTGAHSRSGIAQLWGREGRGGGRRTAERGGGLSLAF